MDEHGNTMNPVGTQALSGSGRQHGANMAGMMMGSTDLYKRSLVSGVQTRPVASAAFGANLPALQSDNLFGQVFVGPYNLGAALKNGTTNQLTMETVLGAAVNVVVSGWIINMITNRPSPLDAFGMVCSAVSQGGMGLFFSPMPTMAANRTTPTVPPNDPTQVPQ